MYTNIGYSLVNRLYGPDAEKFLNVLNEYIPDLNAESIDSVVTSFGLLCAKKSGIKLPDKLVLQCSH